MPVYAFYSIPTPQTTQARLAEVGERRASESLTAEPFAKELEKNPALRQKMQREAQPKFRSPAASCLSGYAVSGAIPHQWHCISSPTIQRFQEFVRMAKASRSGIAAVAGD